MELGALETDTDNIIDGGAVAVRIAAERAKGTTRVTGSPNTRRAAVAAGAPAAAATASQLVAPPGSADSSTPLCTSMLGTSPVTLVNSTHVRARLHE